MSFKTLERDELYRTAIEDFAVDVEADANEEVIRAALLENGVEWKMYTTIHPEAKTEADLAAEEAKKPKAKKQAATPTVKEETIVTTETVVRTKEPEVKNGSTDTYLVKMNRENVSFEYKGYKFTQKHPFVVMDAEATNGILTTEEGFSIATPAEAQEYYG